MRKYIPMEAQALFDVPQAILDRAKSDPVLWTMVNVIGHGLGRMAAYEMALLFYSHQREMLIADAVRAQMIAPAPTVLADPHWEQCHGHQSERYRSRVLTGSINLEGAWTSWIVGRPERLEMNREYEYQRHTNVEEKSC